MSPITTGPANQARLAPSLLRLSRRMAVSAVDQSYAVTVDRLGNQSPRLVVGEDCSEQFWL